MSKGLTILSAHWTQIFTECTTPILKDNLQSMVRCILIGTALHRVS